jgi:hypothetical protein
MGIIIEKKSAKNNLKFYELKKGDIFQPCGSASWFMKTDTLYTEGGIHHQAVNLGSGEAWSPPDTCEVIKLNKNIIIEYEPNELQYTN